MSDYQYQGREDAVNILANHDDEVVDYVFDYANGDRSEFLDLGSIEYADSWVKEGNRYSGTTLDAETAVAILNDIPQEFHETDRGVYEETRTNKNGATLIDLPKTVASMGYYSYENFVEQMIGSILRDIRNEVVVIKSLTHTKAEEVVQDMIEVANNALSFEWE